MMWFRNVMIVLGLIALSACKTMPPPQTGFTEEQVATMQEAGFQEVEGNYELGLANRVLFDVDSSKLLPETDAMLKRLTTTLGAVGIGGARVEGHADASGSVEYNRALSERRARSVAQALIAAGMSAGAVEIVGRGEEDPIESNDTEDGRSQNRRVVIVITPIHTEPL